MLAKFKNFASHILWTSYSRHQIGLPTKETLFNHVLTSSSHKVSQSGVIDLDLPDSDLTFCHKKNIKTKIS